MIIKKLKRRKGTRSRKMRLSRRVKKLAFEALRAGIPPIRCADLIGISRHTWSTWMQLGKENPDGKYGYFRKKCNATS